MSKDNEKSRKQPEKFDARKFLAEAKARQDFKRQAREIAKHSGSYVR